MSFFDPYKVYCTRVTMPRRRTQSGEKSVDHRIKYDATVRFEDGRMVMTDPTGAVWGVPVPKTKPLPRMPTRPCPIILPTSLYRADVTPVEDGTEEVMDGPVVNYIEQKLLNEEEEEDEDWTEKK